MHTNQFSEIHDSAQLMRSGRFVEAAETLQRISATIRNRDGLADAMLADALQRIGQNRVAEELALKHLRGLTRATHLHSRYQFVLGNVQRDRGNTSEAIKHLQIAASFSGDQELACWIQVRLISAVAEVSGIRTALARLDEVRRVLTRFGDARPFVALHLWLVEAESTRGNLESAWRHLRTADSLLSHIDDVWLRGYLAVNRSALHYYSADIVEAREWAETAIRHADQSGHRATRRAAHVNLGNIEFSQGKLSRAEACFNTALGCSEPASLSEVIILENIAQTKLHQRDFQGCRSVLGQLEALTGSYQDAKHKHYERWALQTKIRLLLQEGKTIEARQISDELGVLAREFPHTRVSAASHLLSAETLLAFSDPRLAADSLKPVFSPGVHLPPDLYAEMERVTGNALAMSGAAELAQVHLERACRTFNLIGNMVGKERVIKELTQTIKAGPADTMASTWCLDRVRVLFDLRSRPELFGHEAVLLLQELACTKTISLEREHSGNRTVVLQCNAPVDNSGTDEVTVVVLSGGEHARVTLSFVPFRDAKSVLTALTFQRVMRQILNVEPIESFVGDQEILWSTNEATSVTHGSVFASDVMLGVLRTIKQIAPTDVSVLITGETGVGKEVVARALHERSHRSAMPFLALNCAAVPKDLLESQLFGHRKGAFSGAAEAHPGIVRAANGGTLFLDEIGEIPIDVQAKLLRFLEMSEVHPVGETHPIKVNVRLIFATNGDLEDAVSQNRFRQDLFYRLNVIPIKVPPLRERREEIPVLANLFAQRFASEFAKDPVRFSSTAMELLILYAWPGNIRQLANEVKRLTALAESGACITPEDLSPQLQAQKSHTDAVPGAPQMQVRIDQPLEKATAHLESEMIKHALRQAGGRVSAAASTLGISRKGLYLKRLRLGLTDFNERAN